MRDSKSSRYIVGIDEAGRGPIAGPVTVGAFCVSTSFSSGLVKFFPKRKIRDSKKLSSEAREKIYKLLKQEKSLGNISYAASSVASSVIDQRGITYAIRKALANSLKMLKLDSPSCTVLLDGGLRAPDEFLNQKTIIKGDEKEAVIALASIVAKVTRDALMKSFAVKYPLYDFEIHKGYGTSGHYSRIRKMGFSPIHRRSFLKKMC
ncbi:MAG: ribonuclease HII [Candidatus Taylorbacteria bacterium]|nr:ribonuclease HII [Candidatus Taylorbacteria bacterium]